MTKMNPLSNFNINFDACTIKRSALSSIGKWDQDDIYIGNSESSGLYLISD